MEIAGESGNKSNKHVDEIKESYMTDSNTEHEFELIEGETIKIGSIPYQYIGNGKLSGGTSPDWARGQRDAPYSDMEVDQSRD